MKRTVIGLVGPMVSGKGDVGKHLKRMGFVFQSLSDRVREEADLRGVVRLRENLQDIGNDLREKFGLAVLAERTVEILNNTEDNIVIDAIRNPGEIEFLRQALGITIIAIDAPAERRLQWYLDRAEERGEDTASIEQFHKANDRDFGYGEPLSGQQVGACMEMADITIQNTGTKRELLDEVEYRMILDLGLSPEGIRRSQENK